MIITLLPWPHGPDYYDFDGEIITAIHNGVSDSYDLTEILEGATLDYSDPVDGVPAIHGATRINGELHVTLMQRVIASQYPGRKAHWRTGESIDSIDYDPDACYGVPTGMGGVDDYYVSRGADVAGTEGWTVRKRVE